MPSSASERAEAAAASSENYTKIRIKCQGLTDETYHINMSIREALLVMSQLFDSYPTLQARPRATNPQRPPPPASRVAYPRPVLLRCAWRTTRRRCSRL